MTENPSKTSQMVRVFGKSATAQNQLFIEIPKLALAHNLLRTRRKGQDRRSSFAPPRPEQKPVITRRVLANYPSLASPIGQSRVRERHC